jgi:uncharacterized membrane protein
MLYERAGWIAIILLVVLGLAFAVHRIGVLAGVAPEIPAPASGAPAFGSNYAGHSLMLFVHVVPGILFLVLGPLQFIRRIRATHIRVHRWLGRIYIISGLIIGISGLSIGLRFPISGLDEGAATAFFSAILLFSLIKAFYHIRRRQIQPHREWMIRAFSIGLGISTIRIVETILQYATGKPLADLLGTSFWLGFGLTLIAGEVWINLTRPPRSLSAGDVHGSKLRDTAV